MTQVPDREPTALNERAYRRVRALIEAGSLRPRDVLSENRLARKLGISRTPVREALKRLATEGLVEIYPRRGTFVSVPDIAQLREIFDIREALEGMAARLATPRAERAELAQFRARLETSYRAKDSEAFAQVARDLHGWIVARCGNRRLAEHLLTLRSQIQAAFVMGNRVAGRMDRSYREYRAIIRAMSRGDARQAEEAMRGHIVSVRSNILSLWTSDASPPGRRRGKG